MKKKRNVSFFKFSAYCFAVAFSLAGWVTAEYVLNKGVKDAIPMLLLSIGAWGIVLSCIIFIIIGAGEKNGDNKIHLAHADFLFTEFWIFITGAILASAYALKFYCIDKIPIKGWQITLTYLIVTGCALVLLLCLSGIIRRIKGKVFFKNSICYIICSEIAKAKWFKNISIVWKTLILFAFYGGCTLFFVWLGRNHPAIATTLSCVLTFIYISGAVSLTLELDRLRKGAEEIAKGNLDCTVFDKSPIALTNSVARNLNKIGEGLQHAIDEQIKSERMKSELITNVSHDIKTPLTSIINYVDLLKKENIHNEKANEYIEILDKKSNRLKVLTEDLIEASKATTGNVAVEIAKIDANELVKQAVGELEDKFLSRNLEVITKMPETNIIVSADGRHMWRVIDNMLGNACKYSMENSRVYIDLYEKEDMAVIEVKNISISRLNINEDELMQRFVRGDSSRNTQGSGLGLSIAKSLAEIQGGSFEIKIDGDLFKAIAKFKIA